MTTAAVHTAPRPLTAGSFRLIARNGFGDGENSYPWGSAWFRNRLYIGTARNMFVMVAKRFPYKLPMSVWPVPLPTSDQEVDLRGQVWRYDPAQDLWEMIYRSPMTRGLEGRTTPQCCGFRNLAVFQGRRDTEPALYSIPGCGSYGIGPVVLRCDDGTNLEVVSEPGLGLGDPSITSFRGLTSFKGRLWACPSGTRGAQGNVAFGCAVVCSEDPVGGEWEVSNAPGFGDRNNFGVFDLGVFDDHLYAGTINVRKGCQLWRTDGEGPPPHHWTKLADQGFDRGPHNEMIMSFSPFRGALYLGTGIQNGGHDRVNSVGQDAGEVIRVHPDGSWDLVMGQPRMTRQGLRIPISGLGPGFDNFMAGYIWRMREHDGVLYVGTFDASVFLLYADRENRPPWLKKFLDEATEDKFLAKLGGGELWRTSDGDTWVPITRNGFGTPFNYGVRALVSSPKGLFVGMANPFGPTVATRGSQGLRYEHNPRGGLEIWHGSLDNPSTGGEPLAVDDLPIEVLTLREDGSVLGQEARDIVEDLIFEMGLPEVPELDGVSEPEPGEPLHSVRETAARKQADDRTDPFGVLASRDQQLVEAHAEIGTVLSEYFGGSGLRSAGFWRESDDTPLRASARLVRELVSLLPDEGRGDADAAREILVVGGGAPGVAEMLCGFLPAVTRAVAVCAERPAAGGHPRVTVLEGPIESIDAPDGSFDAVFCVEGSLGRSRTELWSELHRLLRPGGRLMASELISAPLDTPEAGPAGTGEELSLEACRELEQTGFGIERITDITRRGWLRFHKHSRKYVQLKRMFHHLSEEQQQEIFNALPGGGLPIALNLLVCAIKQDG